MPTHLQRSPSPEQAELEWAATVTLRAPSLVAGRPWRWRIDGDVAELRAIRSRQDPALDPRGRMLTMSSGAALHHLRAVLAASGLQIVVSRLPDPGDPDVLARVRLAGPAPVTQAATRHYRSLLARRTDRRMFLRTPVPSETVAALRAIVAANGAYLHMVEPDTLTARGTDYGILFTAGDDPYSWLVAGEAVGAAVVGAAERGAAVVPMRDLVEVSETRETLRRALGGIGHPMLVLRLGMAEHVYPAPVTPRQSPENRSPENRSPENLVHAADRS